MALPSTGQEWEDTYGFNPLGIRKGIITNILIRDYHGSTTNLADPLVGVDAIEGLFSPYATDGLYRDDLLDPDFPGGQWYDFGALADSGTEITPDVNVEGVKIAQSRRDQRWDITEENDEIMWTYRESNPGVDFLRFDKRLISIPDAGPRTVKKPSEGDLVERQVCALAEDGDYRFAYVFPRVARKKVGKTQLNKKDPDDLQLTYGALVCPYADTPVYIVREGSGERSLAGAPRFSGAPVLTQTGATTANLVFTVPTLLNDPAPDTFTYTVTKAVSPYSSYTSATMGSVSVVGSTVTIPVTGLTTATAYKAKVTATGTNTLATTSDPSNIATTA
jgi:hypothetical protein